MSKISATEKRLLIILLGVLIFVGCYFFGFQKLWEEGERLDIANSALSARLAALRDEVGRQEEYEAGTAELEEKLQNFFDEYPVYLQVEDGVMDVVGYEVDADTFISSLAYGESTSVNVGEPVAVAAPAEEDEDGYGTADEAAGDAASGAASRYSLYETPVDIVFETTYAGAKRLIHNIVGGPDKKSITSLLLTFDTSTGILSGTATYANWFIAGQDKVYEGADIPNVPVGDDNIFGTVEPKAKKKAGK